MMRLPAPEQIGYFGKLPACADFVKVVHDAAAIDVLDDWMASVMRQLPANARWKINYDAMAPVSFAFLGAARRHALAGHLVASRDLSGRRFPFLLMRSLDVPDPAIFVPCAPLACAGVWDLSAQTADQLLTSADPAAQLQAIAATRVPVDGAAAADALACFMETATLGALGGLLRHSHDACSSASRSEPVNCVRLILALGLLMQPLIHSHRADLHKSLVLPLPRDPGQRHRVAAFWLTLIAPFLDRAGVDLALFITHQSDRPVLVLGACDAAAETLRAIIDPLAALDQQISVADTGWVDASLAEEADMRTLASYLSSAQLSLNMARALFLKTLMGAAP